MEWQPIDTLKCNSPSVLLFSEHWKHEDFCPTGVREGFRGEHDAGPIYSAQWNDCGDCYDTAVGYGATHWMPMPEGPTEVS